MTGTDQTSSAFRSVLWQIVLVALFNSLIALVLNALSDKVDTWETLWINFVYSHSIGFSIFISILLLEWSAGRLGDPAPRDIVIGITIGAPVGSILGAIFSGTVEKTLVQGMGELGSNILLGGLFGTAIGYYFFSSARIAEARLEIEQQENRHLSAEKELAETRLRLLQAQIEPHFLFNTLSTIHGLIETEPRHASMVLESLSDYLRATLRRTREGQTTLGDELDLIHAYLAIQAVRMGERLRFLCDVPDTLREKPCPPMLVQPLVENAVVHGIEPAVGGGSVVVRAVEREGWLCIEVRDDGCGLDDASGGGHGVAIDNIRARLAALYGDNARLNITPHEPSGVSAWIELPVEQKPIIAKDTE